MAIVSDPQNHTTAVLHKLVNFAGKRVLEIGCGDGQTTWRFAEKAAHVTAIDPSAEDIAAAKKVMPDHLHGRVDFLESSIEEFLLPKGAAKFDLALFGWSL